MTLRLFKAGEPVLIQAHAETHDFGLRTGVVVEDPACYVWVRVAQGDGVAVAMPREALTGLGPTDREQPVVSGQLKRLAFGLTVLWLIFFALLYLVFGWEAA